MPHEEAGQSTALDHALGPLHRFALRRIRSSLCVLADKHSFREAIGIGFQELARQSADKVGLILEKEIEWVERLSSLPEVREAVREGTRLTFDQQILERWKESQRPYFRSLEILDRRGRSVGGVTSESARTYYIRQPWWPVIFEQRRLWVGELRLDEKGSGDLEIAVPIVGDDGTVLGAIQAVIEKDQLLTSVLRSRIGSTGHVMLIGPQGRVLACPLLPPGRHTAFIGPLRDSLAPSRTPPDAAWMEVQDDAHGQGGGIVGFASVAFRPNIVQAETWSILVRQDPNEAYAPLRLLMWKLVAFGMLVFAVVALLRWRLGRRIVRLASLSQFASMFAHDNIEDVDTVVGWLAEFRRPHGFAISETQLVVFILNASRRLFSDRFFTSSFRPEFYTTFGVDWVTNNGPGPEMMEEGMPNGHEQQVSPMKRVLRTMPELASELQGVMNAFDPWARDRGEYYSLEWRPLAGAEGDEAFAKSRS